MPDATSGRFTVNAEKAVYVRQWAEWILIDGYSTNRCCGLMLSKYGIKIGRSTITNVLSDPAMLGKFYAYRNKDIRSPNSRRKVVKTEEKDWLLIYEDPLQSVLSPEQYYALKEKFQRNRENSSRNTKHWYPPLRSLIFCSCGSTMVGVFIGRKEHGYPSYRCLACGRYQRAIPLWEEIRAGIKKSLLDPERLIPAIKDQLESGQAITQLEEKQKANQVQLDNLDQASQKALRVHLSLPNYPIEKLEAEELRIEENRKEIKRDQERLKRQIDELMQAIVNEEGVRRFCEIATGNLDSLNDEQWRVLLETMKVKIFVNDSGITVKLAVPSTKKETSVIAANTSRCSFSGNLRISS